MSVNIFDATFAYDDADPDGYRIGTSGSGLSSAPSSSA